MKGMMTMSDATRQCFYTNTVLVNIAQKETTDTRAATCAIHQKGAAWTSVPFCADVVNVWNSGYAGVCHINQDMNTIQHNTQQNGTIR